MGGLKFRDEEIGRVVALHKAGWHNARIARKVKRSPSGIHNVIRDAKASGAYDATPAQESKPRVKIKEPGPAF